MTQFESWFSKDNLVINTNKTKAILFQLNKSYMSEPVIIFKNIKMNYTSQFRFLDINITNNLKWNSHIQSLCLKLNKVCYIIKSLKYVVSLYILWDVGIYRDNHVRFYSRPAKTVALKRAVERSSFCLAEQRAVHRAERAA
jgi:hypothetical protein